MASGIWEGGRGGGGGVHKTGVWDGAPKSGAWDDVHKKRMISEPTRVESSSANFSMDQVYSLLFLKFDVLTTNTIFKYILAENLMR